MRFAPLILNFSLMVTLPLVLGWVIARRRRVSWRLFGIGAVTFIAAQIGHIPFNYLVGENLLAGTQLTSGPNSLIITAVFLGLSAGLFEEGMRYLSFRFLAKDARTWGRGLMMGAGHGGLESILLGLLGAVNVSILLGYQAGYFQGLVPAEQAPQVGAVVDQLAALSWFEMMLGALERVFALCIQLSLSLLVMQVFVRGRLRWLILAFGWHALIDAMVVAAVGTRGVYVAEALTGLAALISLAIIARLKAPEPQPDAPGPPVQLRQTKPIRIEPTKEKLEESRYI